jgi:hypothetical protein
VRHRFWTDELKKTKKSAFPPGFSESIRIYGHLYQGRPEHPPVSCIRGATGEHIPSVLRCKVPLQYQLTDDMHTNEKPAATVQVGDNVDDDDIRGSKDLPIWYSSIFGLLSTQLTAVVVRGRRKLIVCLR